MTSTDGTDSDRSIPADGGTPARRRPRTAAEQRQQRAVASGDPEVLADQIEKTREELAETLDAIADKVSPKRVAGRTKQKVKDGAAEKAASVKESAAEVAASVKSHAADAAASVKGSAQEKVRGSDEASVPPAATTGSLAAAADATVTLDPAGADVPPARVTAPPSLAAVPPEPPFGSSAGLPVPALAGAGAALAVVALLLWRRRR